MSYHNPLKLTFADRPPVRVALYALVVACVFVCVTVLHPACSALHEYVPLPDVQGGVVCHQEIVEVGNLCLLCECGGKCAPLSYMCDTAPLCTTVCE